MYDYRDISTTVQKIFHHVRILLPKSERISFLDVGCGTGTYTLELWRQGACITGLDQSEEMLTIARTKASKAGADITYIANDFLTYKIKKAYNVVVSLFDVVSYITQTEKVERFFQQAASSLPQHGVFIFDCWYGPGVLLAGPKTMKQAYAGRDIKISRKKTSTLSHATNTVSVHHQLSLRSKGGKRQTIEETHRMRYFFYPELEKLMSDAGFRILHWGELGISMMPPTKPPWSIWIVAQKQ